MIRYEMHFADRGYQYTADSPADGRDDAERSALAAAEYELVGESLAMGIMIVYVVEEKS